MSTSKHSLTEHALFEDLRANAFAPTAGPTLVGLEVEQLAFHGIQAAPLNAILDALRPLVALGVLSNVTPPGKPVTLASDESLLTFEPGGQLEIVSPPRASAATALRDIEHVETLLDGALTWRGIRRANHGMTPWQGVNEIAIQTPLPRYMAMQQYFNAIGPHGERMMRLSYALQINLGFGAPHQIEPRWRLSNLMSPVLIGMFANSPMTEGKVTGWKSTRARIVAAMDPSRTGLLRGRPAVESYLDFALDAGVLVRRTSNGYIPGSPNFTFREWLRTGGTWGYPTHDDWRYHLTTLWPMVRPRGFLELRAMDTAPVRWRAVPVALVTSLLIDDQACHEATSLLEPVADALETVADSSARDGLADPHNASLAQSLMGIAQNAFNRIPSDWLSDSIKDDVRRYDEIYTSRGRCPADDLLDLHQSELHAAREPKHDDPFANQNPRLAS